METNKTYAVVISKRATQMLVSHAAFLAKVSRDRYVAEVLENAQMMADDARRYVDRMAN